MRLSCLKCQGEGRIYKSKYGGNDPDVWDAGQCEDCDGSGDETCWARGCSEKAVGFNDDGEALCEDCLMEWADRFLRLIESDHDLSIVVTNNTTQTNG